MANETAVKLTKVQMKSLVALAERPLNLQQIIGIDAEGYLVCHRARIRQKTADCLAELGFAEIVVRSVYWAKITDAGREYLALAAREKI